MHRCKGFVSIVILGVGVILANLALLFSFFVSRNSRLESEYIRDLNLRKMVYPVMHDLMETSPTAEVNEITNYPLVLGGGIVALTKKAEFSSDNNFRVLSVVAEEGEHKFGLCNYTFIPTDAVQNRAGSYVFSSYNTPVSNTIKYMNGAEYSTGTYFNPPVYDRQICTKLDSMEDIKNFGFGQYIYYHEGNLSIPKHNYKCNSMVIVHGNLSIASGTSFTGRMIFLVRSSAAAAGLGTTTVGSNVNMDDGFILSEQPLVIGSGCNLKGHFRSYNSITIKGYGTFTKRSDAGRPFQSIAFVY